MKSKKYSAEDLFSYIYIEPDNNESDTVQKYIDSVNAKTAKKIRDKYTEKYHKSLLILSHILHVRYPKKNLKENNLYFNTKKNIEVNLKKDRHYIDEMYGDHKVEKGNIPSLDENTWDGIGFLSLLLIFRSIQEELKSNESIINNINRLKETKSPEKKDDFFTVHSANINKTKMMMMEKFRKDFKNILDFFQSSNELFSMNSDSLIESLICELKKEYKHEDFIRDLKLFYVSFNKCLFPNLTSQNKCLIKSLDKRKEMLGELKNKISELEEAIDDFQESYKVGGSKNNKFSLDFMEEENSEKSWGDEYNDYLELCKKNLELKKKFEESPTELSNI